MTDRTLGELTVEELLKSAQSEVVALGNKLDDLITNDEDAYLVRAYIGSVGARIAVAKAKLREES